MHSAAQYSRAAWSGADSGPCCSIRGPLARLSAVRSVVAVFVPLGFLLGVMARAGRLIGEHKSWCDIRRDLGISLLISGANMLLAALIIQRFDLSYLPGLAVSFGCAFSGVGSVIEATRLGFMWLFRHFVEDSGREAEEVQRLLALASLEAERAEKHRLTRVELRKERGDEDQ